MGKVVNIHKEPYDVLIDRTTKWGNPYSHKEGTRAKFVVSSRKEAIEKYRDYVLSNPYLIKSLPELEGKVLGCHCKPKSCHGDILLELLEKEKQIRLF